MSAVVYPAVSDELRARVPRGVLAMPWHGFKAQSGAWMLHPSDVYALDPIVLIDHFVMPDSVFAPHPHAGFSAVTYLFDDSTGGIVNRDTFSAQERLLIQPGDLHWTQAGTGMQHEEVPITPGHPAHGLQMFVNSSAANKRTPPAAFHIDAASMPVVCQEGATVKVVLGEYAGASSLIGAHTPIRLLDIRMSAGASLLIPVPAKHNAFALIVGGVLLHDKHDIGGNNAVLYEVNAVHESWEADDAVVLSAGDEGAHVVLISGAPLGEPLFQKGPFIGNSASDVTDMIRRFQTGHMGQLAPTYPPA
jgi:redox-sensitive bicupin YhaK (pirin superfamily)